MKRIFKFIKNNKTLHILTSLLIWFVVINNTLKLVNRPSDIYFTSGIIIIIVVTIFVINLIVKQIINKQNKN